jgi:hypothetical protein
MKLTKAEVQSLQQSEGCWGRGEEYAISGQDRRQRRRQKAELTRESRFVRGLKAQETWRLKKAVFCNMDLPGIEAWQCIQM